MTEQNQKRIEDLIANGYDFDLSRYISEGFELFKRGAGSFIGFILLTFLILLVVGFIPLIGQIATNLILGPALITGGYLAAHTLAKGEQLEFGRFFKGFDFIGPLATAALVVQLIVFGSMIPMFLAWGSSGFFAWIMEAMADPLMVSDMPSFPLWSLIFVLPAIYLGVAYGWVNLFIAFYGMGFWEAMEASRRIITKQWLLYFAFLFVLGLLVFLGALALVVGLLVAMPVLICAQYAAFADVTRLMVEEGQDITDHLVV